MDTTEQQHLSEDTLRSASHTQFTGKAEAMDAWLQQQYQGLIGKAQDITKDQDMPSQQSTCPKLFAATEAGCMKPHELKLLCSQLHFNWQNESAKLAVMREKYASLLQDYRELEEQLDLAAACRHSLGGCGTHSAAWTPEEVSVTISTRPVYTVQHRATSCRVCVLGPALIQQRPVQLMLGAIRFCCCMYPCLHAPLQVGRTVPADRPNQHEQAEATEQRWQGLQQVVAKLVEVSSVRLQLQAEVAAAAATAEAPTSELTLR